MCGFAGTAFSSGAPDVPEWARSSIAHRGPDDSQTLSTVGHCVHFARLAIVGLSSGQQPFYDPKTRTVVSVNGEIYNHALLRRQLERFGFSFSSASDGEVVLWGYLLWGTEIFSRLDGMFAIAIFDSRSETLVLGRDRIGEKPLYWRRANHGVHYCSEAGGLMQTLAGFSVKQLHHYFIADALGWGQEYDSEIENVVPGTFVRITRDSSDEESYFDFPEANHKVRFGPKARQDSFQRIKDVLERSTASRLMSEVPVGVFLSGGVDSQLVTAVASRVGTIECAYTLRFHRESFDETHLAVDFADRLGIPVKVVNASVEDLAEAWSIMKDSIDEPFADSAILPQMLLAREAAGRTKVVLTGDGGDELFMGYQHVRAHQVFSNKLLGALANQTAKIISSGKSIQSDEYFSMGFKVDRLLRARGIHNLVRRDLIWRAATTPALAASILPSFDAQMADEEYRRVESSLINLEESLDWRSDWTSVYLRGYLPEIILRKVDRATMRFGVEARPPLLDPTMVCEVLSLPRNHRYTPHRPKALLTDILRSYVPGMPMYRKKHGMGIPLSGLLSGPLQADLSFFLGPSFIREQGLFSPEGVLELNSAFSAAPPIWARAVWSLLIFQVWWQRMSRSDSGEI